MCGISGLISNKMSKESLEQRVSQMMETQRHRGPDDEGAWSYCDNEFSLALGHNRLSIIDISEDGHQPMIDETTGNVIVFNGEIYL